MQKNTINNSLAPSPFVQTYFYGTIAELTIGEKVEVGYNSNFGQRKSSKYILS